MVKFTSIILSYAVFLNACGLSSNTSALHSGSNALSAKSPSVQEIKSMSISEMMDRYKSNDPIFNQYDEALGRSEAATHWQLLLEKQRALLEASERSTIKEKLKEGAALFYTNAERDCRLSLSDDKYLERLAEFVAVRKYVEDHRLNALKTEVYNELFNRAWNGPYAAEELAQGQFNSEAAAGMLVFMIGALAVILIVNTLD